MEPHNDLRNLSPVRRANSVVQRTDVTEHILPRREERRFAALTLANPRVRYSIVPDPMRILASTLLPKRTFDKIIAKRLGLTPQP